MTKKKNLIFLASFLIVLVLGVGTFLFAADEDVINEYLSTGTGFLRDVMDNIKKSALSDNGVTRDSSETYVTDSINYEPAPVWENNAKLTIGEGELPNVAFSNGKQEKVNQFVMTISKTENMNSNEWREAYRERMGIESQKDVDSMKTPVFADIGNSTVDIKVEIKNGKYVFTVPDGLSGLYVLTKLEMTSSDGEKITLDLRAFQYQYLNVGELDPSETPTWQGKDGNDTDPNQDDGHRYSSLSITPQNYSHMSPSTSGSISNPSYDVSTAIPTSENLNFSATADDSLYDITQRTYNAVAGVKNITIVHTANYKVSCAHKEKRTVTKTYTTTDKKTGETKNVTRKEEVWTGKYEHSYDVESTSYTVTHNFSYEAKRTYYDVPKSDIYPVSSATISGAPIDGSAVIALTGGPTQSARTIKVLVNKPSVGDTYSREIGGLFDSYSQAQAAARSGYERSVSEGNIRGIVEGSIGERGSFSYNYRGLSVTPTTSNGVTPEVKQASGGTTKMIPSYKTNGLYVTDGSVSYAGGYSFGMSVNNVFVHTPVVNNASITNVQKFVNQKINVDSSRVYLQLDKSFTITIPRSGTHISAKGYGTRAYNSYQAVPKTITNWGKIKDVKLPFDAYLHEGNARTIIKAGHWLSEYNKATTDGIYTFTIPVWAKEGTGTIETRVVAENGSVNSPSQEGANLDSNNYVATKNINVEVIGKIYDLRISSTNDPGWQNIKGKNGSYISASEFAFGQLGQNAVTNYKYAPKLGYTIAFDFKTKGIKSNNVDVSIQPEGFYFVSKNGGSAEKVDLFYNTTSKKYIKITTGDNTNVPVITNLTSPFMKVSKQELIDSTRIMKTKLGVTYNYASNVNIGYFPRLKMPENLRLCYNNFAEYIGNGLYKKTETAIIQDATNGFVYNNRWGVLKDSANGKDVVIGAVGHWYAGYKLPASTVAAPSGTTSDALVKNPNLAKKDGYILVKFNIRTDYNEYEYLEYKGPESLNEGTIEKDKNGTILNWPPKGTTTLTPSHNITLPNGKTATVPIGVVGIFETDFRSSNDYETEGTH